MIHETLTAIGMAGRRALQSLGERVEVRTQISQVREWSFAMPSLARITVANSPIHQVYAGISQPLAQYLGDLSRQEVLYDRLKQALVERIPASRPIGALEILPPDGSARVLRGVRSFILRQQTAVGNLYLMAEVASRGEYESMRQAAWEEDLARQLLPRNLAKMDTIESQADITRLGSYLSRFEHDIEMLLPGADGLVHSGNGVLVNTSKGDGRTLLWLSVDFDKEQRTLLQPGRELEGSFGAAGRVFRFRAICAGSAALSLEGVADLSCTLIEMPQRFNLDQRRRYFRVTPGGYLSARMTVSSMPAGFDLLSSPPSASTRAPQELEARVVDLSFSGVGLVLMRERPTGLCDGCCVQLRLTGEGLSQNVELSGLVRRLHKKPCGRGRYEIQLGIEFIADRSEDRQGLQVVRQYVMAQQRELLASRTSDQQ